MTGNALAGLFLLAVGLCAVMAFEVAGPSVWQDAAAPSRPAPVVTRAAPRTETPDLTARWVETALARPVFEPSRRPRRQAGPVAAAGSSPLPRVTGVMVSGSGRKVIFAGTGDGRPIIAQEGTQIGAYTVSSIAIGEVTIEGPEGTRVLRPAFDGSPAPPPPPRRPPQPGLPGLPGLFPPAGPAPPPPGIHPLRQPAVPPR